MTPSRHMQGTVDAYFAVRLRGALVGAIGFFFVAYHQTILGTALLGIDSLLIAASE